MSKSKKEILIEERLKMLREDPFGWEDKGPYYEKYDEQTRFIIRKPKPTYFKPLNNEVEFNSRF